MPALVLLSGGLDSTVAAALFAARGGELRLGLCLDYGQRAARREALAAQAVGERWASRSLLGELPLLAQVTGTALVRRDVPLPAPDPARLDADARPRPPTPCGCPTATACS